MAERHWCMDPPHSAVFRAMKSVKEWTNETVSMIGGMVWGEYEMADFIYALEEIQPLVAVDITPFAFKEPDVVSLPWDYQLTVDAALYGSILNQRWRVYVWGPMEAEFLHFDVLHQYKRLLSDGYCEAGMNPTPDANGLMRIVPFDAVGGLTMTVRTEDETLYSVSTHIPQLTLNELWSGTTLWP